MLHLFAALTIVAASALVGACSQASPTAPTPTTRGVVVGSVSQETAVPAAIVPVPSSALGATRFLSFGDSITAGVESQFDGMFLFDSPAAAYPLNLQGMLNRDNQPGGFVVINRGQPGEGAYQAQSRLTSVLTDQRPQVLLLLEGINDMVGSGRSATQAASSVAALVDTARIFNCTVLVATMPQTFRVEEPLKENAADRIVPFNNELRRLLSGRQNVHIVDLYAAFENGNNRSLIGGDGLHPTAAGYARIAQAYHAMIQQVFPVRGSLL
jgi:lysophospholipase L1-like esterase